jgi:hypothetical protein
MPSPNSNGASKHFIPEADRVDLGSTVPPLHNTTASIVSAYVSGGFRKTRFIFSAQR